MKSKVLLLVSALALFSVLAFASGDVSAGPRAGPPIALSQGGVSAAVAVSPALYVNPAVQVDQAAISAAPVVQAERPTPFSYIVAMLAGLSCAAVLLRYASLGVKSYLCKRKFRLWPEPRAQPSLVY